MKIYLDDTPIDVIEYYAKTKRTLPPIPTMSGLEIRLEGGNPNSAYQLWQSIDLYKMRPVGNNEAVGLANGMHFHTVPPATY